MRERIAAALKAAQQDDDPTRLATLRLITAAIRDRDACSRGADDECECVSDADLARILATMIRQREAQIREYEEAGRLELAERERQEIAVIREFLPRPLSDAELRKAVAEAIAETRANSIRDVGAVMGALKSRYAGRVDPGRAGAEVRNALR